MFQHGNTRKYLVHSIVKGGKSFLGIDSEGIHLKTCKVENIEGTIISQKETRMVEMGKR